METLDALSARLGEVDAGVGAPISSAAERPYFAAMREARGLAAAADVEAYAALRAVIGFESAVAGGTHDGAGCLMVGGVPRGTPSCWTVARRVVLRREAAH